MWIKEKKPMTYFILLCLENFTEVLLFWIFAVHSSNPGTVSFSWKTWALLVGPYSSLVKVWREQLWLSLGPGPSYEKVKQSLEWNFDIKRYPKEIKLKILICYELATIDVYDSLWYHFKGAHDVKKRSKMTYFGLWFLFYVALKIKFRLI